jgi:class 3 adenylate cyclase|tara:strand:- start:86 stop:532 length:447 start_codon:yes stop_codon:yes gene_type:complete
MADGELERRLAAILVADVAGYLRLMGDNEHATVAALDSYRDIFCEHVGGHGRCMVDTARNYDKAIAAFAGGTTINSDFGAEYKWLAAANACTGGEPEAGVAAVAVFRTNPKFYDGLKWFPLTDLAVLLCPFCGLHKAVLDAQHPPPAE